MRAAILCFDDLASGYRTRGWATRAAAIAQRFRAVDAADVEQPCRNDGSCGTFETCRGGLTMSVDWDRAEVTFQGRGGPFLPSTQVGIHATLESCPMAASAATVRVSTENNF